MINLTYKQAKDLVFISGMMGGKPIEVKLEQRGKPGINSMYAYCGKRCWWLPKQGEMREVVPSP